MQKLQESVAFMQAELTQLSEEMYAQQREITRLNDEVAKLKVRRAGVQPDSGIVRPDEDVPPPHY